MVKVSVIIPIYNAEEYLYQCLDSLCVQTLKDIEIICVDDGSTDTSLKIIEEYSTRDSRIKVLHQTNQYAGVARNKGMNQVVGKYLTFLDADDFFEKDFLEKMYAAAEQNDSDVVICRVNHFDNIQKRKIPRIVSEELDFLPSNVECFSGKDIPDYIFQIANGWPWDKIYRTEFIKQHGLTFQEFRIANDGFFVYMALVRAKRITKISDFLVNQRFNNMQSLSNTREKHWYCGFQMIYNIKQYLQKKMLYDLHEKSFLNFCLKYAIWSFEAMKSWTCKEKIYNTIRDEFVNILGISKFTQDYFYNQETYSVLVYMCTHTFDEYLCDYIGKKDKRIHELERQSKVLNEKIQQKVWVFPFSLISKNSNIVLYGAGNVGQDYFEQIEESGYCNICLWMDKKFEESDKRKEKCGWLEDLNKAEFEKVVIALRRKEDALEAMEMLKKAGVSEEKFVWKR